VSILGQSADIMLARTFPFCAMTSKRASCRISAYFAANENCEIVAEQSWRAVLVGTHLEQLQGFFEQREWRPAFRHDTTVEVTQMDESSEVAAVLTIVEGYR
jgi:hypothetical protein